MQTVPTYLSQRAPDGLLPQDVPGLKNSDVLNKRSTALKRFIKEGLPTQANEDWRYLSLRAIEEHVFATPSAPTQKIELQPLVSDVCGRAVLVNGVLDRALSQLDQLPQGLVITTLQGKLDNNQITDQCLPTITGKDSWHDLNLALFNDALFIKVMPGAIIEKPLEIISVATQQQNPTMHHLYTRVFVGEGAALKIMHSTQSDAGAFNFATSIYKTDIAAKAALDVVTFQHHAASHACFVHDDVTVAESAHYKKTTMHLGGQIVRDKTTASLTGAHANVSLRTLTYAQGTGTSDVLVDMRHHAPDTQSSQLIRSIAAGKSRAVFQGKITVDQAAQKTNAAQNHQGLLLSDNAEIDAKPSLEIYADDVKCSHGNTCGALDETALFYMRSRGIPKHEAEQLLQQAFISELVEGLDDALQESLLARITDATKVMA